MQIKLYFYIRVCPPGNRSTRKRSDTNSQGPQAELKKIKIVPMAKARRPPLSDLPATASPIGPELGGPLYLRLSGKFREKTPDDFILQIDHLTPRCPEPENPRLKKGQKRCSMGVFARTVMARINFAYVIVIVALPLNEPDGPRPKYHSKSPFQGFRASDFKLVLEQMEWLSSAHTGSPRHANNPLQSVNRVEPAKRALPSNTIDLQPKKRARTSFGRRTNGEYIPDILFIFAVNNRQKNRKTHRNRSQICRRTIIFVDTAGEDERPKPRNRKHPPRISPEDKLPPSTSGRAKAKATTTLPIKKWLFARELREDQCF
ncbi:hypothetical protein C8J56DRAFT_880544 [Mycena floridula]|nr:hypothetical protein C8J56DRAFT_880544 [Mycena floridula]